MKLRYRARALADLDDISRFLHERSPSGARNVLGALAEAIDDIPAPWRRRGHRIRTSG